MSKWCLRKRLRGKEVAVLHLNPKQELWLPLQVVLPLIPINLRQALPKRTGRQLSPIKHTHFRTGLSKEDIHLALHSRSLQRSRHWKTVSSTQTLHSHAEEVFPSATGSLSAGKRVV